MTTTFLEIGRTVRWRSQRWRILEEEQNGFVHLVGVDQANRDLEVMPLLTIERDAIEPDALPLPDLDVTTSSRPLWRAFHRAHTLTMAGAREHLVGLDWGAVTVEPYQLVPLLRVARTMRTRLLIADDTGLGKTAEAGIILRWLAQRHQANRVLVVTRASPEPERWQQELWTKFGFEFDILKNGEDFNRRRIDNPNVNVFAQQQRFIISMTLAARQVFLDELRRCPNAFDVVIVDEAHHLAERGHRTKRLALLGRALAHACPDGAMLLLTATPHDGKTATFLSLLRLLEPFAETNPGEVPVDVASRLVVRRLKPEVTLAGGKRFIPPEIHVRSTIRHASPEERSIEEPLAAYIDWLRSEEERYAGEGARQKATGCQFLATILLKRFGSSVAALRATLRRRLGMPPAPEDADEAVPYVDTDESDPEDEVIDPGAEAEAPPPALSAAERELAAALLDAAEQVPVGRDSKLQALVKLLSGDTAGEKAVVFTEYRDTLRAARRRLDEEGISYVTYHGGTPDPDRQEAIDRFLNDPDVQVFLATDAASEGKNLQRGVRHLVHLDVPWNPNRYAQRNGRIDRYGQHETPHLWVLVAADKQNKEGRPEYRALEIVIEKLSAIQTELGSVGHVLPGFSSGSVRDVLLRGEKDAERQVEEMLSDPDSEQARQDLTRLTVKNKREIEEAEEYVQRLGTVDDFESGIGDLLRAVFKGWDDGGAVGDLGDGLVRVSVPTRLRSEVKTTAIDRATFRRDVAVASQDEEEGGVEFLSPGHPLVAAVVRRLRDEATSPTFPHRFDVDVDERQGLVLSYLVRFVDNDGRTVEERLEAVEVARDGTASSDGQRDLERLGIDAPSKPDVPDPEAVAGWQETFPDLEPAARREAAQRAEARREELERVAQELVEEELEALALWRHEEERKIERLTLPVGQQLEMAAADAFRERMDALEAEYERRRETIRDRTDIRVAGVDLLGGRLIVGARA